MRWSIPLLILAACGGSADRTSDADRASPEAPAELDAEAAIGLRIDVYPTDMRDADYGFRVLPQTHTPLSLYASPQLDVGDIELKQPRLQTGTVQGFALNPLVAALPGEAVPVDGTVYIGRRDTVQSYASTIEAGEFETWVVPVEPYRLTVVPDDPMLPMTSQDLTVRSDTEHQDIDLGLGAPIYGQVRFAGGPLSGARVHVVDAEGIRSATSVADQQGLYQVRVQEGVYTVVCEGQDAGQDPTLALPGVTVDEDGINVDITYPTDLPKVLAQGRVKSASGSVVPGTVVRFVAESLDGYEGLDATWSWEAPTAEGTFIAQIVPGVYTVELLPPVVESGPVHSPLRLEGQAIGQGGIDFGLLELEGTTGVAGRVVSQLDEPLEGAVLDCTEVGFDSRSWFTTTGADGGFVVDLPRTELECIVSPPGARGDLASGRFTLDPRQDAAPVLTLGPGTEVRGRVVRQSSGEPLAVIEVRDLDDRLLGTGLTSEDGTFSIRVDVEGAHLEE